LAPILEIDSAKRNKMGPLLAAEGINILDFNQYNAEIPPYSGHQRWEWALTLSRFSPLGQGLPKKMQLPLFTHYGVLQAAFGEEALRPSKGCSDAVESRKDG
jgi:hypothetical protein